MPSHENFANFETIIAYFKSQDVFLLILKLRLHILKLHPAHFHPPTRFPMKWEKIENRAKIMTQKTAETWISAGMMKTVVLLHFDNTWL